MLNLTIEADVETWPIAGEFAIVRGAKREAAVVVARVSDGSVGESVSMRWYMRIGTVAVRVGSGDGKVRRAAGAE